MYQEILANISRHILLSPTETEIFTSLLTHRKLKRKEFLSRENDIVRHLTFVVSGCLRMYSTDEAGKEHIIMFSPGDWWCGDLHSFLSGKKSKFNIDALESTETLQLNKKDLEVLYQKVPKFERFFRILFQNAFIVQQNRISANLSLPPQKNYERFLITYPSLERHISQKYIASYIGVTPEFFSKMKAAVYKRKS